MSKSTNAAIYRIIGSVDNNGKNEEHVLAAYSNKDSAVSDMYEYIEKLTNNNLYVIIDGTPVPVITVNLINAVNDTAIWTPRENNASFIREPFGGRNRESVILDKNDWNDSEWKTIERVFNTNGAVEIHMEKGAMVSWFRETKTK